tara:strand:- start:1936 stop:2112 length:177 start_codon:yes stop_codon:yes gene_type:complete
MTESHSIFADKKAGSHDDIREFHKQQLPFGNILKTVNAHFELLLLITVLVSILVTSIF